MKTVWLGQAGLYLQIAGLRILVDPYLSDSVGKVNPLNHRRVPVDEGFFDIQPDVLMFTHDHLDHYDPESAERFLGQEKPFMVLAPGTCWSKARASGGKHNYVLFNNGTQWTEGDVRFTAVPAAHSDPGAIGILVEGEGKCLYITGDTLYNRTIFPALPENIDVVFLPINGAGNNMNPTDAARFARDCGAKCAVPLHWGLFDDMDPRVFTFEPKVIPEFYMEVRWE